MERKNNMKMIAAMIQSQDQKEKRARGKKEKGEEMEEEIRVPSSSLLR